MRGDQARARIFAKKCAEARKLCEGSDGVDATEMEKYAAKPASQDSYGGKLKWKQGPQKIPSELDADAFERCLWRSG